MRAAWRSLQLVEVEDCAGTTRDGASDDGHALGAADVRLPPPAAATPGRRGGAHVVPVGQEPFTFAAVRDADDAGFGETSRATSHGESGYLPVIRGD